MESVQKTNDRVHLLFRQDNRLSAVAPVAVVDAGEKPAQEGTSLEEKQGARQEWFTVTFHVQSHIKLNQ